MFSRTFTGIIASSKNNGGGLTQSIIYDDPNYYPAGSGPDACNPMLLPPPNPPPMPIDIWYSGTGGIGDFIYYDSAGTIPVNGFFGWWKTDITMPPLSVQISFTGEIIDTYSC
jgi:hypothetical protein